MIIKAMNPAIDCGVVIPCLNEAATIGGLVTAVREQLSKVVVVDDGSTDATGTVAQKAGAEILRHDKPRGKGAALRTGWRHLIERRFRWALTMDGDGQHSPEDTSLFLNCAERTSAPLVIGNRMHDPAAMPRLRRLVNRWMSREISKVAGYALADSQCGFRLMNLEILAVLPIRTEHFEIESEVLLAFAGSGCRIEFVPIQVIYKQSHSKIHPLLDTIRWLRWRYRGRSLPKRHPYVNIFSRGGGSWRSNRGGLARQ